MATNGYKKAKVTPKVPTTDPAVYDKFQKEWSSVPANEDEWVGRARRVAQVLLEDAVKRDKENKSPRAEIALLKHSGLLKILGPKKYGGGGQSWEVGYKAIREVAKADGYTRSHFDLCRHY